MPDTLEIDQEMPDGLYRWPLGDPLGPDFMFCRTPVTWPGELYCAEHRARAWRTPEDLAADRAARLVELQRRRGQVA